MYPNEINGLVAGTLFLVSGLCGLIRHFLLEPTIPPPRKSNAPRWLLNVFFVFSSVMVYVGLRYICDVVSIHSIARYTGLSVLIAANIAFYKIALLVDTILRKPSFTLDDIIKGLNNIKESKHVAR